MPTKPTPKERAQKTRLKQLVKLAKAAGLEVSLSLEPNQMPARFPDDPEPVKLLIAESERCSTLGNRWLNAKLPNYIAAEMCLKNGWAYALAAAWMRAKLKGELLPEKKD